MYCLIKKDMKFGEYTIPARTKAKVINKPKYKEANIPGLHLYLAVTLWDISLMKKDCALVSEVEIRDELENYSADNSKMVGITIRTDGTKVLMDAGDAFYDEATITEYQVQKVLNIESIPSEIKKVPYAVRPYYLRSLTDYLENEFAAWVKDNCEFYTITEDDIENGECSADSEPGDTPLSDKGIEQFENKKIEYQKMIENIGFTYDFKGGLVWE